MQLFLISIVFQLLYYKFVDKFNNSKAIGLIVLIGALVLSNLLSLSILETLILITLLNLSFSDISYFEVCSKSYIYLFIPILLMFILNSELRIERLISFIIVFLMFQIMDLIIGIEHIGGADVKIILLLSLSIIYINVVMFLITVFIINIFIFLILKVINLIKKNKEKVKIPMIVSITISWVLTISLF